MVLKCERSIFGGGGGKRKFIFVLEEEGYGWSKIGEALRDLSDEMRNVHNDGSLKRMRAKAQPQPLSYREALMVEDSHAPRFENEGVPVQHIV